LTAPVVDAAAADLPPVGHALGEGKIGRNLPGVRTQIDGIVAGILPRGRRNLDREPGG
jgi:hypothetical protein